MAEEGLLSEVGELAKNIAVSVTYLGMAGVGFYIAKGIVVAVGALL